MADSKASEHLVILVGAGPAGIYASRKLLEAGHTVLLLNRDIKPGGLAEYGIFLNKYKMKDGLRKQFKKIFANPKLHYFGHVSVGEGKVVDLNTLQELMPGAIVIAAGAQGTKKLGIPGEDFIGVYHAKDVVYHYNSLPPFSQQKFEIGNKVAIIGMGNVMVDIAHWLLRFMNVGEVLVVARRGPLDKAYDDKEFEYIQPFLDLEDMQKELDRIEPKLTAVGQNTKEFLKRLIEGKEQAPSNQRLKFRYLCSPRQVLANSEGKVAALEVEENELVLKDGRTSPKGTEKSLQLEVDNVIYAIGDQVDPGIGIPSTGGYFVTNPEELPGTPNPAQYQAYDPEKKSICPGIFLIGWSRNASVGLVGVAKQDAERGAKVINEYLTTNGSPEHNEIVQKVIQPRKDAERGARIIDAYLSAGASLSSVEVSKKVDMFKKLLKNRGVSYISKKDLERIEAAEKEEANERKVVEYHFPSDDEMLAIVAGDAAGGSKAVGVANVPVGKN